MEVWADGLSRIAPPILQTACQASTPPRMTLSITATSAVFPLRGWSIHTEVSISTFMVGLTNSNRRGDAGIS